MSELKTKWKGRNAQLSGEENSETGIGTYQQIETWMLMLNRYLRGGWRMGRPVSFSDESKACG